MEGITNILSFVMEVRGENRKVNVYVCFQHYISYIFMSLYVDILGTKHVDYVQLNDVMLTVSLASERCYIISSAAWNVGCIARP